MSKSSNGACHQHNLIVSKTALVATLALASFALLSSLAPSADVKARAEGLVIKLSDIPKGTEIKIEHDNLPIIIRHRTTKEISDAEAVSLADLQDKVSHDVLGRIIGDADDKTRRATPDGEYIALVGVSDRCVVMMSAGDYSAWFDVCQGGHFDNSGRIRKGANSKNLRLPVLELVGPDQLRLLEPNPYLVPNATLQALGQ